ncbi:MAG: alpha/beta fold hydrolase, partial [Nitrospira defluvii]|nr:alpha/beta fold hydrolase [Nitrospira defluvii]
MPNDSAASRGNTSLAGVFERGNQPSLLLSDRRRTAEAWSLTIAERRASPRLEVHLSTVLHCGDRNWRGETGSIGLGGVALAFAGDVPAMLNQHVRLSLGPDADGLNSLGIVCGIRASEDVLPIDRGRSGAILAVQFVRLSAGDERVVASLFADGGVRSREVCVAAALVVQESEEVLIDAGPRPPVATFQSQGCVVRGSEEPRQERRRHRRVAVGFTTDVRLRGGADDRILPGALTKDLTSNGAPVSVPAEKDLVGSELLLQGTRSADDAQGSTAASVSAAACSVVAEVMWTSPERAEAIPALAEIGGQAVLAGGRFLPGAEETEAVIEQLLGQPQEGTVEGGSEDPSVTSEFSECFRPSGFRIVLCHDRPRTEVADDAPIVVLAPGYGESKRDYVPLAYYLAGNGFHVVRYDNVNHVGESDGVVTQFRLQDMERDLETVLHHVAAQWPGRSIGLVATSLAGRVALKVTGGAPHVRLLVLINGIMDVRHTLQAVHQEDLIGEHLAGVRKGVVNILGLTI